MALSPQTSGIAHEARRRRAIAVISHPDAGKSTLTEALLLRADAIGSAGAVHGKRGRKSTVSDWMDMERERGISISSTVIQFHVEGTLVNLVDTPGHADFSEDTYRVLSVVDAVIMLIDASKGVETQTKTLFDVCFARGIPIITMINKWDRPGRDALDLVEDIQQRTGLVCTPRTWPVGLSGDFRGLLDPRTHGVTHETHEHGGAVKASAEAFDADTAAAEFGADWDRAIEEVGLLEAENGAFDAEGFGAGQLTPLFFGSATRNIGVADLLDFILTHAPAPAPWRSTSGELRALDGPFSGYVFKVQTGLDPAHRDRVAFMRVCSGIFERGMTVTHARTARPFTTKYSQQVFGRDRQTADTGWPGDVIGLVNAGALRPGDTLFDGTPTEYPGLPRFAPEHFQLAAPQDTSRGKQFRRGVEQLDQEGVVQLLSSERRGPGRPIVAAVGPLQFETFARRMIDDFHTPVRLEPLEYTLACDLVVGDPADVERVRGFEVTTRSDGTMLVLVRDRWILRSLAREAPNVELRPLHGAGAVPPSNESQTTHVTSPA